MAVSFHFAYKSASTRIPRRRDHRSRAPAPALIVIDGPPSTTAHRHRGVLCGFGFAANLSIGDETEQGSSPVRPTPGMRVVQSLVASRGFALVHVVHHVAPDLLRGQLACFDARNRFNIGGHALFYPVLFAWQRGKSHVFQFVSHHPIVGKVGSGVMCCPTWMRVNP